MAKKISFTFTELLYGVVIGTAILRIETLSFGRVNILVIIALFFVFDDYLLYHQEIEQIDYSGKGLILLFWLDMIVLGAWYALTLASKYPTWIYLLCVAIFFAATSLWELIFSKASLWRRLVLSGDVPIVLSALVLSLIAKWRQDFDWLYIVLLLAVFVVWRFRSWMVLWRAQQPSET